jgi:hypothetical protein
LAFTESSATIAQNAEKGSAMSLAWWHLPGARRFIEEAASDIRDGKNLILCLPPFAPEQFERALSEALSATDDWLSLSLDYAPSNAAPLDFLYSRFLPAEPPGQVRSLGKLLENLTGKIIWLADAATCSNWAAWQDFLSDYQRACRHVPLYARTIFVVPLTSDLCTAAAPAEDVCLARREWRGALDEIDALLYSAALCRRPGLSPVKRRLAIALAANLAIWDLPLAERLADEPFENLLEPAVMLESLAAERGWHENTPHDWENGTLDYFGDAPQPHSAVIVLNGQQTILTRRVWSAQSSVLLPYVEERRQNLLGEFKDVLPPLLEKYPVTTRFNETIRDIHDLEIGHLESLLGKQPAVAPERRREIENLRRIRNDLSHLRRVSPPLLSNL